MFSLCRLRTVLYDLLFLGNQGREDLTSGRRKFRDGLTMDCMGVGCINPVLPRQDCDSDGWGAMR